MATKKYTLSYAPIDWWCVIEIAEEVDGVKTIDRIKEMVEFWSEWESLLSDNNGDYTSAFLKQLARQAYMIASSNQYNTYGVVEEFNDMEGWCKMDGSCGIKILSTDDVDVSYGDFEIESIDPQQ